MSWRRLGALLVLLSALLVAALLYGVVRTVADGPPSYWMQIANCGHGHRSEVAKTRIVVLLHAPYVRRGQVRHYNRCVATREKRRYLTRVVESGWRWRAAHYWELRLAREPAGWRAWAERTAWCESKRGTDPRTNLNGFRGIFQWVMSTWRSAGGTGDPAYAGYAHEAVIAIGLARSDGTQHWPNCG